LTVSSLLYAPGTETVAVVVLNAELAGDIASTAAIGVLLTAIVLLVAVPIAGSGSLTRGVSSS
jgi:iron(III) transport system permease protein